VTLSIVCSGLNASVTLAAPDAGHQLFVGAGGLDDTIDNTVSCPDSIAFGGVATVSLP
jgi:hypothetical protein